MLSCKLLKTQIRIYQKLLKAKAAKNMQKTETKVFNQNIASQKGINIRENKNIERTHSRKI